MSGASHIPQVESSEEFNAAVLGFIAEHAVDEDLAFAYACSAEGSRWS